MTIDDHAAARDSHRRDDRRDQSGKGTRTVFALRPVDWSNAGAAALSLALTSGAMVWCRVPHPPAGGTTLIVSLGILREPWQLGVLMHAVCLLVVQGFVINRLAGIDYPLWSRPAS
jgi:CBS-domain-containing membrane protein